MRALSFSRVMLTVGMVLGLMLICTEVLPKIADSASLIGGYVPSDGSCCTGTTASAACSQCKACPTCPYYGCSGTFTECDMVSYWTSDRCDGISGTEGACVGINPACNGIQDSACN